MQSRKTNVALHERLPLDRGAAVTSTEIKRGDVIVRACLPLGWKVRDYVSNHHYVELEGPDGETVQLPAQSLVKGECMECKQVIYVETRMGEMKCPHCLGEVSWVWGRARLAFIADSESAFGAEKEE